MGYESVHGERRPEIEFNKNTFNLIHKYILCTSTTELFEKL